MGVTVKVLWFLFIEGPEDYIAVVASGEEVLLVYDGDTIDTSLRHWLRCVCPLSSISFLLERSVGFCFGGYLIHQLCLIDDFPDSGRPITRANADAPFGVEGCDVGDTILMAEEGFDVR